MFSLKAYEMRRPLGELFEALDKLSDDIKKENKFYLDAFYTIIDQELSIIRLNWMVFNYKSTHFVEIICSLCYKNLISLLSVVKLIEGGYLGSAKMIFRNVYESLLIGKLIGVAEDDKYYDMWYNGQQFSMKKDIFSNLKNQASEESLEFWDILNKYTHATVFSQDFYLEYDSKEIANCSVIIGALLEMNYHLLNKYVSYYYNFYLNYYYGDFFKEQKKNVKTNIRTINDGIDSRIKKVIKNYIALWTLK